MVGGWVCRLIPLAPAHQGVLPLKLKQTRRAGQEMHTIKTEFKASSPMRHRRWGGKFTNPRITPRRPKAVKAVVNADKPHGQED